MITVFFNYDLRNHRGRSYWSLLLSFMFHYEKQSRFPFSEDCLNLLEWGLKWQVQWHVRTTCHSRFPLCLSAFPTIRVTRWQVFAKSQKTVFLHGLLPPYNKVSYFLPQSDILSPTKWYTFSHKVSYFLCITYLQNVISSVPADSPSVQCIS